MPLPISSPALLLLVLSAGLCRCASTDPAENFPDQVAVLAATTLPEKFLPPSDRPLKFPKTLQISQTLIDVTKITRPRVELREGPGIQFKLYDRVLRDGTEVALFQRQGVWQKVLDLQTSATGWVHKQALSAPVRKSAMLPVASAHLPVVFAQRPIDRAFDFKSEQPLVVKIPKGRAFLGLTWRRDRVLIYLTETNSVLWLREGDAQ